MSILNMILAQVEPVTQVAQQAADTLQQTMDSAAQAVSDSIAAIAAATAPVAEAAELHCSPYLSRCQVSLFSDLFQDSAESVRLLHVGQLLFKYLDFSFLCSGVSSITPSIC